jgi:hypothetical protein
MYKTIPQQKINHFQNSGSSGSSGRENQKYSKQDISAARPSISILFLISVASL